MTFNRAFSACTRKLSPRSSRRRFYILVALMSHGLVSFNNRLNITTDAVRLKFRRNEQQHDEYWPGRGLAHMRRRSGELKGSLVTSGYFSVDICLGTPARKYELVVDTGSSITSVPCHQCATCGVHQCGRRGRFDEQASSTAERASCPWFSGVRPAPSTIFSLRTRTSPQRTNSGGCCC